MNFYIIVSEKEKKISCDCENTFSFMLILLKAASAITKKFLKAASAHTNRFPIAAGNFLKKFAKN
jgi:hypothetical protein